MPYDFTENMHLKTKEMNKQTKKYSYQDHFDIWQMGGGLTGWG